MVQLILIRPGSTDYDLQSRIQGTLEIPLAEKGRVEAAQAAEKLRPFVPKTIYCSPGNSTKETAAIIGKALNLKPKPIDQLKNVNLGLWQGMSVEEVRRKQPKVYKQWQEHPETVHPPEGETLAEASQRVEETLEKLSRKHKNGVIAVVAAEPLASIIRQRIEGNELGDLWRTGNGGARIDVLNVNFPLPVPARTVNGHPATNGNGAQLDAKAPERSNGASQILYRGVTVERH